MITVSVLMAGGKKLEIGHYADAHMAELIATSWARQPICKAAIITPVGGVPLILIRPQQVPATTTS